jgi:tRNA pseudouridine32 synthase / 23S rRNA pseudouridine746 synthase
MIEAQNTPFFIKFDKNTEGRPLPKKFTFPFSYEPHPLSLLAAKAVQYQIKKNGYMILTF